MYLSIVVLPLVSALIAGFAGRWLGKDGTVSVVISCMVLALISVIWQVYYHDWVDVVSFRVAPWFVSASFVSYWGFLFDTLTIVMCSLVVIVSVTVHLYSLAYMGEDPCLVRFLSYLSLFTFFMLMLVTADNFLQLFVGWEGVGLCSYLLINFWYTRVQANMAGIKAILVNRIGDFGLLLGMVLALWLFGSVDFLVVFSLIPFYLEQFFSLAGIELPVLEILAFCFLIGVIGKSAQIGLHTWLPDAMEGPTPVSALIHAATMVTAGIFLVIRCSPLFEYTSTVLVLMSMVGAFTAFFAAVTGLFQVDIKRVIAYSTCSQLGYMALCCGLSQYQLSFFHLYNHGFFKALLFLSAGCVIHYLSGEQDMRRMGGLGQLLPSVYVLMLIGSLALIGMPGLSGFYSKDLILEVGSVQFFTSGFLVFWLELVVVFFSAYYSGRVLFLVFLRETFVFKSVFKHAHALSPYYVNVLLFLAIASMLSGYLLSDFFVGVGVDTFAVAIYGISHNIGTDLIMAEFIPASIKMLPFIFTVTGLFASAWVYYFAENFYKIADKTGEVVEAGRFGWLKTFYYLVTKKWAFDVVYQNSISRHFLKFSYTIGYLLFDRGFLELFGPSGLVTFFSTISRRAVVIQTGYLYDYILVFLVNLGLILLYICYF